MSSADAGRAHDLLPVLPYMRAGCRFLTIRLESRMSSPQVEVDRSTWSRGLTWEQFGQVNALPILAGRKRTQASSERDLRLAKRAY